MQLFFSRAVSWRERHILIPIYIKGRWFMLYMYVCIHVASEPVCPTQGHEKQAPSSWDWTRHMGRGCLHAKQGALPRGPSDPSHLHTWLLLWPDISKPSVCTASSPVGHSYWLKTSKGVESIPQLKEKQKSPLPERGHQLRSSGFKLWGAQGYHLGSEAVVSGGGGLFRVLPPSKS